VSEVIHDFLEAKIKVWMLTGDKLETAENIGKSCKLITPQMELFRFPFMEKSDLIKAVQVMV
jgi:P-type E1-E2 ATPase